jgi:SAM-dependent methyltransferase
MNTNDSHQVFSNIYVDRKWGSSSRSGPGSEPHCTRKYRRLISRVLKDLRIRSVVDLGCGDWSFSRDIDWTGVAYTGVDVVPELIGNLNNAHGKDGVRFICTDLTRAEPPEADLVIIKDVLQHLPNHSVLEFLAKLRRFHYALMTNDCQRRYRTGWRNLWRPRVIDCPNIDTTLGGWRLLRLRERPFQLPAKELMRFDVRHGTVVDTKEVLLWTRNGAPQA